MPPSSPGSGRPASHSWGDNPRARQADEGGRAGNHPTGMMFDSRADATVLNIREIEDGRQ
jgi:hypothetical protein